MPFATPVIRVTPPEDSGIEPFDFEVPDLTIAELQTLERNGDLVEIYGATARVRTFPFLQAALAEYLAGKRPARWDTS